MLNSYNEQVKTREINKNSTFSTVPQNTFNNFLISNSTTKAEILWCLKNVYDHSSQRSDGDCSDLFKVMFPDSQIAQKFRLHRTKIAYSINYGIAPYYFNKIMETLKECEYFVLAFDESMNKIAKKTQMDLWIKYYDKNNDIVMTRYFDSIFLKATKASDLLAAILSSFDKHLLSKLSQLSMDGPNVNFKVMRELNDELRKEYEISLIDIGSCGLHVVHNALKNGIKITGWKLLKFLRAVHFCFDNVPTRKNLYTSYTGSTLFGKRFCTTRWVENADVALTAYKMLPHLRLFVTKCEEHNTIPECESYTTISKYVKDKLLGPKLSFYYALASTLEPFLTEFQTDKPMVPFLYKELKNLVHTLMKKVVKPEALDKHIHCLSKINLSQTKKNITTINAENVINAKDIVLDFSTSDALKKAKPISDQNILKFKEDVRLCFVKAIEKLLDRSPIKFQFTQHLSCLDPALVSTPALAAKRMSSCLEKLIEWNRITGIKADHIKNEFEQLYDDSKVIEALRSFKRSEMRLDTFWIETIQLCDKDCRNFLEFVKMILIILSINVYFNFTIIFC